MRTLGEGGFGLLMALCVLFGVGAIGLSVAVLAQTSHSSAARAADRTAAYYLAEGIVERGIAEVLSPQTDWTSLAGDTLYANAAMGGGTCTLIATAASAKEIELTARASYRAVREAVRLSVKRQGSKMRWRRLETPFAESKEE